MRDPKMARGDKRGALAKAAASFILAAICVWPAHAADRASDPASRIIPHVQARALPAFRVFTGSGMPVTEASLPGRITLLNIWATWCSACLQELPALDHMQEKLGENVRVVAVSQDREGAAAVYPYLQRLRLRHVVVAYDREAALTTALGARALPITLILDKEGKEIGRVTGDLDWADPSVVRFMGRLAGH